MSDDDDLGITIDESPALSDLPENDNQPSELVAPATPQPDAAATPPAETEEQKQARIAKEAFENRSAKRKLADAQKELAGLKAQMAQKPKPEVPVLPDPTTVTREQFQQSVVTRDEAIRQAAAYDAAQQAIARQQQEAVDAAQREKFEALNKVTQTYGGRAVQLGLKPDELQQAGAIVAQYGIDDALAEYILHDDQGPLITKFFASNLAELDRINSLPPLQAAVAIETLIKPKAASLKPKVSNAPPPSDGVGSGVFSSDYNDKGDRFI